MNLDFPAALPNGLKMRGGAYLVEEVLAQGDNEFSYRAYDVAARCAITLHEFFPTGARRNDFQVRAPSGWSIRGYNIAKAKWLERHCAALAVFEENGTTYAVMNADSPRPALQHDVQSEMQPEMQPKYSAPAIPVLTSAPAEIIAPAAPMSATRPRLSFFDLWPDAVRGAIQGSLFCGVSGVILGALAALLGEGSIVFGVLRGLWLFPIGALCGALIGVLRALPSNAAKLATQSPLTAEQQWQSTLSGALKGALLGGALGLAGLLASNAQTLLSMSTFNKLLLLFTLAGAIGGAVVGFIRINPRDRSRRS